MYMCSEQYKKSVMCSSGLYNLFLVYPVLYTLYCFNKNTVLSHRTAENTASKYTATHPSCKFSNSFELGHKETTSNLFELTNPRVFCYFTGTMNHYSTHLLKRRFETKRRVTAARTSTHICSGAQKDSRTEMGNTFFFFFPKNILSSLFAGGACLH